MVTTEVAADDASRYGIVQVGDGGTVDRLRLQARRAGDDDGDQRGLRLHARGDARPARGARGRASGDDGLEDLGSHLLPAQTRDGLARAYPLEGYWRDVGTVPAYWQAHRDFLAAEPPIDLDDPAWPMHTRGGRHSAARRPARRGGRREPASPAAPGSPGRCAARCSRRAWWSRRARRSWTRCCCPACGCGPGRR